MIIIPIKRSIPGRLKPVRWKLLCKYYERVGPSSGVNYQLTLKTRYCTRMKGLISQSLRIHERDDTRQSFTELCIRDPVSPHSTAWFPQRRAYGWLELLPAPSSDQALTLALLTVNDVLDDDSQPDPTISIDENFYSIICGAIILIGEFLCWLWINRERQIIISSEWWWINETLYGRCSR